MNYIPEIAKMLGVEIGEEFRLRDISKTKTILQGTKYRFNENNLQYKYRNDNWKDCIGILNYILKGDYEIIKPIIDNTERKYLSSYIKPWRDKVVNIIKAPWGSEYAYINIRYYDDLIQWTTYTSLPTFEKDTMYKGMELDKDYSLKDLGL